MLATELNDDAGCLKERSAPASIARLLAPTETEVRRTIGVMLLHRSEDWLFKKACRR